MAVTWKKQAKTVSDARGSKPTADDPVHDSQEGETPPLNLDVAKFVADFHKQMTTLSTASLLLMLSFIDKLFPVPKWKWLVAVTMVGFLSTVICCVCSYWLHLYSVETNRPLPTRKKRLDDTLGFGMLASFMVALGSLVVFFTRNYLFP